jgi:hypothetical protein
MPKIKCDVNMKRRRKSKVASIKNPLMVEVEAIVSALHVPYNVESLGKNLPSIVKCELFGTVISGIEAKDYSFVKEKIEEKYKGFRIVFVTTADNLIDKKDDIIWELMRSGYMRYIRQTYPKQFNTLIMYHSLGNKIINERLRLYGDRPCYQFLVEENKAALRQQPSFVLSIDTSFYDYMPEK